MVIPVLQSVLLLPLTSFARFLAIFLHESNIFLGTVALLSPIRTAASLVLTGGIQTFTFLAVFGSDVGSTTITAIPFTSCTWNTVCHLFHQDKL